VNVALPAAHPLEPEVRAIAARDLAGLILALLLAAAPHALRAPWWLVLLTVALYAWRAAALMNRWPLPGRALLLLITAAAMAGVWLEYRMIFARVPGIVLLLLFSGVKLLEARTQRDAAVVAFLCFFLIITNLLYTQSIPTALLMVAALAVITAALVGCSAPGRALRANVRTAGLLLAHAVPAALLLFLLFPRVQGPTWGLPQDAQIGITGLSDTMTPGNVSELAQSDALAFRAQFDGPIPPPRQRYWRGPVLWDFDGRTWRAGVPLTGESPRLQGGQIHRYTVVLESHRRNWLFALETAVQAPAGARFTADGQLFSRQPVRSRLSYDMVSVADGTADPDESAALLRRALQLPPDGNPRARALAAAWQRDAQQADEVLAQGIEFFRAAGLTYTLEPPPLGENPVDEFLHSTRSGFCEHFSSAFAFLMRAAGIPARVVTGYLGGDPNPVDGILTVRQRDAHAWVEVHLPGRGWTRIDPTAAAVPGRLDFGLARAVPQTSALPLLMRPGLDWLRSARYNWEALVHQWNLRVLGYNPDQQREFMARLGVEQADWRDLAAALAVALGAFALTLLAWSLWYRVRPDPVQSAWLSFCARLARRGVARGAHEGPRDFTDRASGQLPRAATAIRRIGELYLELRYGRAASPAAQGEFARRVRELRLA
jgi:transglutaminase-like putative cysteine protease